MAPKNSFADVLQDWEVLLRAYEANAEDLEAVEPHRAALEQTLSEVRDLKALQDSFRGLRQQTTQQIVAKVQSGLDLARRLRGFAKGVYGPSNERLVQFQVAPIRRRGARKSVPVAAPEVMPALAPEPEPPTVE